MPKVFSIVKDLKGTGHIQLRKHYMNINKKQSHALHGQFLLLLLYCLFTWMHRQLKIHRARLKIHSILLQRTMPKANTGLTAPKAEASKPSVIMMWRSTVLSVYGPLTS